MMTSQSTKSAGTMADFCISCSAIVGNDHEAMSCSDCDTWQHCTCGTTVSRSTYTEAMRQGRGVTWKCEQCRLRGPGKYCYKPRVI